MADISSITTPDGNTYNFKDAEARNRIPTKTSALTNDSGFVDTTGAAAAAPVQSVNGQTGDVTVEGAEPVIASISFPLSWTDSGSGYYTCTPTISGVTVSANGKVDLQPTAAQTIQLQSDGVASLHVVNSNGSLAAYAIGHAPTVAMTMQCTVSGTTDISPDVSKGSYLQYFTAQTVNVATNAEIMRITDETITEDTIVLSCVFDTPPYVLGDITWTSYAGYVVFTGTSIAATTADVVLGIKGN